MHSPDNLSSHIVERSQVFTRLSVLKDLSALHEVAGIVAATCIAWLTAGKRLAYFTSSIIEILDKSDLATGASESWHHISRHKVASARKLSKS